MKQKLLITCALFSVLLYACSGPKSSLDYTSKGNPAIPENFNPATGVLLIEQNVEDGSRVDLSTNGGVRADTYTNYYMKKKKKEMTEYADKHYPYKHEFASQNDIYDSSSKYADKNTYQFALVTSLGAPGQHMQTIGGAGVHSTHNAPIFKFYIYDRLNNKTYSALSNGSAFLLAAFKEAIEKVNQGK